MSGRLIYDWKNERMAMGASLWNALALSGDFPMAIALVGAGGKTTTMYALAEELAGMGKRVLVTTTTHIRIPAGRPLVLWPDSRCVGRMESLKPEPGVYLVAGTEAGGGKLKGLPADVLARAKAYADVVLIEADGARGMPFKIPRSHEPSIPECADAVIACMGLDCLDRPSAPGLPETPGMTAGKSAEKGACCCRPLRDVCFGWEAGLGQPWPVYPPEGIGWGDGSVTPELAAGILLDERGGRKLVGGRPYRILLNKADGPERVRLGREVALAIEALSQGGQRICVMTSYPGKGD